MTHNFCLEVLYLFYLQDEFTEKGQLNADLRAFWYFASNFTISFGPFENIRYIYNTIITSIGSISPSIHCQFDQIVNSCNTTAAIRFNWFYFSYVWNIQILLATKCAIIESTRAVFVVANKFSIY